MNNIKNRAQSFFLIVFIIKQVCGTKVSIKIIETKPNRKNLFIGNPYPQCFINYIIIYIYKIVIVVRAVENVSNPNYSVNSAPYKKVFCG